MEAKQQIEPRDERKICRICRICKICKMWWFSNGFFVKLNEKSNFPIYAISTKQFMHCFVNETIAEWKITSLEMFIL